MKLFDRFKGINFQDFVGIYPQKHLSFGNC